MAYKLSDRPKWWVPRLMKWAAIIAAVFTVLFFVVSIVIASFEVFDVMALGSSDGEGASLVLSLADLASESAWAAIGMLFYAVVFWMLALAVDKIDQLVWLNATDEDRAEILAKRKKKRVKSPASEERA